MTPEQLPTDDELRDRAWRGYDGRAMLPVVALAAIVSLILLTGHWYLTDLTIVAERFGPLFFFGLAALVWGYVAAIWLYRTVTYTYRINGRAVLVDRGFRALPEPPVWLTDVGEVHSAFNPLGRWLRVGRVEIVTRGGRRVVLTGVHDPAGFAAIIRTAAAEKNQAG